MSDELRKASPIDVQKAIDQHGLYMEALSKAVSSNLVVIDADERHPDCVFIEDTAVLIGPNSAVSTRIGTHSRQGEEAQVASKLIELGYVIATKFKLDHLTQFLNS